MAAALLVAATLLWLYRPEGSGRASDPSSAPSATVARGRAIEFSTACSKRGGTVVEVHEVDGRTMRRCAVAFDDGPIR